MIECSQLRHQGTPTYRPKELVDLQTQQQWDTGRASRFKFRLSEMYHRYLQF